MKRKDGWILLAILALAFLCYLFFGRTGKETAKGTPMVRISAPGQETRLIPLDQEEMLTLEGENGARNVVRIFPGGFSMAETPVCGRWAGKSSACPISWYWNWSSRTKNP